MKTGFSLMEILHRENPVLITGEGFAVQCEGHQIHYSGIIEYEFHSNLTVCLRPPDISLSLFSGPTERTMVLKNSSVKITDLCKRGIDAGRSVSFSSFHSDFMTIDFLDSH